MRSLFLMNSYLILSDIHGNLSAFDAVIADCNTDISGVILLGDLIDYGMRSDEIIDRICKLSCNKWKDRILCNIWGNHEKLIFYKDYDRLSSVRGRAIAKYTYSHLSPESINYIDKSMDHSGYADLMIDGFKVLAVHGSSDDRYWKAISPDCLRGDYYDYDIVMSGHSHDSHFFTHYYPSDDPAHRNKKAVHFINPGSVGQPRNHNPYAQYAILTLPSMRVELRAVEYDIGYEQSLYTDEIDQFYRDRLTYGV